MSEKDYELPLEVKELLSEPEVSQSERVKKLEELIGHRVRLNKKIHLELSSQRTHLEDLLFQLRYTPLTDGGEKLRKVREERHRVVLEENKEAVDYLTMIHRLTMESNEAKSKLRRARIKKSLVQGKSV